MQRSVVLSRKSGIVQTIERPRPTSVAIKTDRSPDSASSNCIVRVEHMQLKRWVETIASEPLFPSDHHEPNHTDCPFPVDPRLNTKIALWTGDLTTLDCDAIVNPTNESFSDNSPFSKRLFVKAGKPLVDHVRRQLQTCRTGDLKLSDGFGLPCRHVLHTVGPKYKPQFHSAAETALFSCYQRVLSSLLDHRWSSIGIPPIHTARRAYPPQDGAHIALRTIRRFLEKYHDRVELIVLAIEDIDGGIYESMLPLYFPRNQAEQKFACYKLPINIGGTNGEPILPERAIRIQDKPLHFDQDSIDLKSGLEASVAIGRSTFAMMQADVDKRWLKKSVPGSSDSFDDNQYNAPNSTVHYGPTKENQRRTGGPTTMPSNPTLSTNHVPTRRTSETDRDYRGKAYDMRAKSALNVCDPLQQQLAQKMRFEALLRAAQQADVSSVARLDWLYMNGHDRLGRKLLVLIGAHLPRTHPMLQLCFLQLVRSLERMRTGHDDFVLLYVHSNCETADEPSVQFVRRSLDLLPATYVERLSCVYVLHAGLWFRMTSWWFMQFRANWLKTRITFIRSLAELDSTLPLLDLRLPQFVLDHDFKINGLRYVAEDVAENL